jgi:hypothetical protein
VDKLVSKDYAVKNLFAFNIACLFKGDEGGQQRFYAIRNDFGDDLIDYIVEGYGIQLVGIFNLFFFGDKS